MEVNSGYEESLLGYVSTARALRTHLRRWRERVVTAPPVLSLQLLAVAMRNRHPVITNELPGEPPLFVLATGRSGTNSLAAVLALAPGVMSWHEPLPDLHNLSRQVYLTPESDKQLVSVALKLARAPLWQAANMTRRRYIETSYYLNFLAPFLHQMLPEARFLYFTRAPQPFARSATRFGWYSRPRLGGTRLAPHPDSRAAATWESRDAFGKNIWFWQEANRFARDFVCTLPPGQGLHLHSEDVFRADAETLRRLYALIDSEVPPPRRIRRVLDQQLNAGRLVSYTRPEYSLSEAQRELLEQECGQLARELGYASVAG